MFRRTSPSRYISGRAQYAQNRPSAQPRVSGIGSVHALELGEHAHAEPGAAYRTSRANGSSQEATWFVATGYCRARKAKSGSPTQTTARARKLVQVIFGWVLVSALNTRLR